MQATIEERLALLKGAAGDGKSDITGPVESLATLLAQALQSDDHRILNVCLSSHKRSQYWQQKYDMTPLDNYKQIIATEPEIIFRVHLNDFVVVFPSNILKH